MADVGIPIGDERRGPISDSVDRPSTSTSGRTETVLITLMLLALSLLFLAPALGVVLTSFKSNAEIAAHGLWTPSGNLTTDNYLEAWTSGNARTYILNSFLVTVPATVISVALGSLVGYTVAKLRPRGSQMITLFFVAGSVLRRRSC